MAQRYLMGVDLGTTGVKAGIIDDEGTLIADAYVESQLYYPEPGEVEQYPDDVYREALEGIRACLTKSDVDPSDIACIAFDSQMAGIGTVDENWGAPTVYDSWLDTRCRDYIPVLKEYEDRVLALSGGPPTISIGAKILWWMHERPQIFHDQIDKFVVPSGYVAGRMAGLSGDDAFMDFTYIHFSCLSDTRQKRWSEELTDRFNVDRDKLPRIVNPWDVIGHVTDEASEACGLKAGTPIAAGCGDTTATMLGAAMVEPGAAFDVAGTASVFAVCIDRFVTDQTNRTLLTAQLPIPGLYYMLGFTIGGGLNLRWFRDELAHPEREQAASTDKSGYEVLDEAASEVPPGSDKLLFLPHLGGRVCPSDPNTRGVYLGLNWSHSRAHLYRAMLEGVAYDYAYYLDIVQDLLPDLELRATRALGGGAQSELWNQIKADVLGMPYVNLNRKEFAVLGSAIVAGHAVGIFDDLAETAQCFVQPTNQIEPDMEHHRTYQPFANEYRKLLDATKPIQDDLATIQIPSGEG